ncbi:MAG: hypothetical protein IIX68_08005 [Clostridia bacterium]|nr:hypothetical protein [Clostridia bacterium]
MATYGSEAYDLSIYEPKAKIKALPGKKATKAEKRRARLQKLLNTVATAAVAGIVLLVIGFMISSQVRLTELNSAIGHAETALDEAIGETKRLESELAAQTSAQSVEEYAESAGLRQVESGQIDYITVTPVAPESTDDDAGFWATVWNTLTVWLQ